MEADILVQEPEMKPVATGQSFVSSVQQSLQNYFTQLDGQDPANLYSMVLSEIEAPLLKMVMLYTNGNQSKAAKILGISRGTLRKKLSIYHTNDSHR
ncbi:MAG: DNA-binding transcriptional regulator Fis [Coxiella endosymbiont of Haemaphysalis qinghaiensis]